MSKRFVLPGAPIPHLTIVHTMVSDKIGSYHIEALNLNFKELHEVFPEEITLINTDDFGMVDKNEKTTLVKLYILLPDEVITYIKLNTYLEKVKERINFLLNELKLPPATEYSRELYIIPQLKALQLASHAYKNQQLVDYFKENCTEIESQETVIKQEHNITIISAKKKHWWSR